MFRFHPLFGTTLFQFLILICFQDEWNQVKVVFIEFVVGCRWHCCIIVVVVGRKKFGIFCFVVPIYFLLIINGFCFARWADYVWIYTCTLGEILYLFLFILSSPYGDPNDWLSESVCVFVVCILFPMLHIQTQSLLLMEFKTQFSMKYFYIPDGIDAIRICFHLHWRMVKVEIEVQHTKWFSSIFSFSLGGCYHSNFSRFHFALICDWRKWSIITSPHNVGIFQSTSYMHWAYFIFCFFKFCRKNTYATHIHMKF